MNPKPIGRPAKLDAKRKLFNLSGESIARLEKLVEEELKTNPKATETEIVERAILAYRPSSQLSTSDSA